MWKCNPPLRRGISCSSPFGLPEEAGFNLEKGEESMSLRFLKRLVPLMVVLALATVSALAKDQHSITLRHNASLNGTAVAAGSYKVTWSAENGDPTVNFVKGKENVASAQAKWVDRNTKYDSDQVVYSNDGGSAPKIVEIRFAGKSQVLVFEDSTS
jgi:hypothetical protein